MTTLEAAKLWAIMTASVIGSVAITTQALLVHQNQRRKEKINKIR